MTENITSTIPKHPQLYPNHVSSQQNRGFYSNKTHPVSPSNGTEKYRQDNQLRNQQLEKIALCRSIGSRNFPGLVLSSPQMSICVHH